MNNLWTYQLPGGAHYSEVVRRGTTLRITAPEAGANVALILYNYEQLTESYNMADTLKGQHTAYLTRNHVLYSDMGRAMCSITRDSCGWHDPIGGLSDAKLVQQKYGNARYQEFRNDYYLNGRDSMLNELKKYGMGMRDLVPPLNLFSKVTVNEAGKLQFQPDHCAAGASIELRFEMNCLAVLSTCQHPLDPAGRYAPKSADIVCFASPLPSPEDPARTHCPENTRAFVNTERHFPATTVQIEGASL